MRKGSNPSNRCGGRLEGAAHGVGDEFVAAEDEEVGDFEGFLHGVLGESAVCGAFEDLAALEVFDGGDGVATDEECVAALTEQESTHAGGDAREWEEVDASGEFVGRGFALLEQHDFAFDFLSEFGVAVLAGALDGCDHGDADLFAFGRMDHPFGAVEGFEGAAAIGVKACEEDMGDVGGGDAGAFIEAGGERDGGQAWVDEDVGAVIGGDERRGRMSGAHGRGFVTKRVGIERANGDDPVHGQGRSAMARSMGEPSFFLRCSALTTTGGQSVLRALVSSPMAVIWRMSVDEM